MVSGVRARPPLATLRPDVLHPLLTAELDQFFDSTQVRRVSAAQTRWLTEAQSVIDANLDQDLLAGLRLEHYPN